MKKLMTVVCSCLVVLTLFFVGCNAENFEAVYLTYTNVETIDNDIAIISNKTELLNYSQQERFSEVSDEFTLKLGEYAEDFFNENKLVIINIEERSSATNLSVKSVSITNSEVAIVIKRKENSLSTDDIKCWSIFVEINSTETLSSATYTFN